MYFCYIDESGTPDIPGNSSHFILAGIVIPVDKWKDCDKAISDVKLRYGLENSEIHTAWMLRTYLEQSRIPNFVNLSKAQRIHEVRAQRTAEILRLQRASNPKLLKQTKKNYIKTADYVHLTRDERNTFMKEVADCISNWDFARVIAECIDKIHFDPVKTGNNIERQSFEQIVSRFETYLQKQCKADGSNRGQCMGLLIHDNNETVSKRHTQLMKEFHQVGTFWTSVTQIIETPLFVDSQLTSMVQIADLCSYALRRYIENREEELFDAIFKRADRNRGTVVGVRHYTSNKCLCKICVGHRMKKRPRRRRKSSAAAVETPTQPLIPA